MPRTKRLIEEIASLVENIWTLVAETVSYEQIKSFPLRGVQPQTMVSMLSLASRLWLIGWFSLCFWLMAHRAPTPADWRVYVFLGENCVISQHYTLPLRELHAQYAAQGVDFVGLFPNGYSTEAGIAAFEAKYQLPFALQKDSAQAMTQRFGVKVTPEVVVYDVAHDTVRYQGRIDDQYARVGRRRLHPTTAELADALAALTQGQPVPVARQPAVGCFITQISTCR